MPLSRDGYATARTYYGSDDKFPFILVSYWFHSAGTTDPAPLAQNLATLIAANVHVAFANVLCTTSAIYGTGVSFNSTDVIYSASTTGPILLGNEAGDESSDSVAVVIRKRTESPGRRGYGRWFVGAVPESLTDSSSVNAAGQIAYDAFSASLLNDLSDADDTWTSQLYSHANDSYQTLVSTHVDRYMGTQRRRRVRLPF